MEPQAKKSKDTLGGGTAANEASSHESRCSDGSTEAENVAVDEIAAFQSTIAGYKLEPSSGWYINEEDPSWQYEPKQGLHFHTVSQTFYIVDQETQELVPYISSEGEGEGDEGAQQQQPLLNWMCKDMKLTAKMTCMQGRRPTQEDRHTVTICNGASSLGCQPFGFFGVYDGHLGTDASEFCEKSLQNGILTKLRQHMEAEQALASTKGTHDETTADEAASAAKALTPPSDEAVKQCIVSAFEDLDKAFLRIARVRKRLDGSCVVCALVLGSRMFVANLGDSRCVVAEKRKAVRYRSFELVTVAAHCCNCCQYYCGVFDCLCSSIDFEVSYINVVVAMWL
eukprot:m.316432 g.316432  ORF g.316432 m.316432 type:complete len:340 (-) comp15983_c1_seq4:8089-9108(-)